MATLFSTSLIFSYEEAPYKIVKESEKFFLKSLPLITHQKQAMRNMNLSLLVYGNTILNAGDIITFSSPVQRPGEPENNPYTSGRYVIMAIKHMVNVEAQRHEMVLKCFKDAVSTPYPTEEDALNQIGRGKGNNKDIYTLQKELSEN